MGDLNSARSLQYLRQPTTPVGSPRASAEPPKLESAKVVKFQAAGSNANGKYCIEYQVYGAASVVQSIWRTLSAFDSLHKVLHEWNHWVPSIAGFAFFNGQEKKLEQLNKFLAALVARPVRGSQSDSALDQFFGGPAAALPPPPFGGVVANSSSLVARGGVWVPAGLGAADEAKAVAWAQAQLTGGGAAEQRPAEQRLAAARAPVARTLCALLGAARAQVDDFLDANPACLDLWAKTFYPGLEASPSVVAFLSGVGQGEGQV